MRLREFVVEEFQPRPATFADGTLRLSQHLQNRSAQREISMTDIMKTLQRLEATRGADLKKLPPTSFVVKTPNGFELAVIKSQDIDTKKITYVVATVRTRLKPAAGQRIIYLEDTLLEYQGGAWRLIRGMVPRHWPDYVVKDWLYGKVSDDLGLEEKKYHIQHLLQEYPVKQWRLEQLPITMDIFTPGTQEQIRKREGGSKNPFQVPRDTERHATQAAIIKKQGVSGEPVIMLKKPDGYDLVEGWHRTIQNLQAHPEGYTGPAWVGYL